MKKHIPGLTNKKGSVLFLVLAIMTILIIAASAAYYMVLSNRGSVEARRKDEQSYQTAISVNNGVSDYIDAYLSAVLKSSGSLDTTTNKLVKSILALPVGSSITTTTKDGNLASLEDYGMGEYEVVITKTGKEPDESDGKTVHTFEIVTTADVDGRRVKLTQIKTITTGPSEYFTRFFTSTGKRPEDVRIRAARILTDLYMENDYTILGGGTTLMAGIYATGSVYTEPGVMFKSTDPNEEMVIGQHFYIESTNDEILPQGGKLMVGGNFIANSAKIGTNMGTAETFVLGDFELNDGNINPSAKFYINGDATVKPPEAKGTYTINGDLNIGYTNGGTYYVGGDVHLTSDNTQAQITCAGKVYDKNGNEITNLPSNITNSTNISPWPADEVSAKAAEIAEKTGKQKYEDWNAEEYFNNLDSSKKIDCDPVFVKTDENGQTQYAPYEITDLSGVDGIVLNEATSNGNSQNPAIIIDADATYNKEPLYVYLKDSDGDGFSFWTQNYTSANVLIKGARPVIFVLPEGTDFKANRCLFVGHYDWLKLKNSNIDNDIKNGIKACDMYSSKSEDQFKAEYLYEDPGTKYTLIRENNIGNNIGDEIQLHNNIFLVTKGDQLIDFYGEMTSFWGYVYAPDAVFDNAGSGGGGYFAHVGGMILGSYVYDANQAKVAFTTPYDYYGLYGLGDKSDIVKYLMGQANDTSYTDPTSALQSFNTIGYIA